MRVGLSFSAPYILFAHKGDALVSPPGKALSRVEIQSRLAQVCQVGHYRTELPIDVAMRCLGREGSTHVFAEPRGSFTAITAIAFGSAATSCKPEPNPTRDFEGVPPRRGMVCANRSATPGTVPDRAASATVISALEEVEMAAEMLPRVLLAEDNRDLQLIFARQLNLLGLDVIAVGNGLDAVELVLAACQAGNPFDLVLMDLEMPIVDGYEATRRLRDGGFRGPILALSGHSSDDLLLDCLRLGCNDCICKPVDWIQLAELIRKYVPGCKAPVPILIPDD